MAIFNEILAPRFSQLLFKLLSMKGSVPTKQLAGEIAPVIEVENLPVELRILANTRLWTASISFAASAGNFNQLQLLNPVNSGVVGVVEKITFCSEAAGLSFVVTKNRAAANLVNALSPISRDIRSSSAAIASALTPTSAQPAATNGNPIFQAVLPINTVQDVILQRNQEIVLPPGDSLSIFMTTVNNFSTAMIWWRERGAEPSELTAGFP